MESDNSPFFRVDGVDPYAYAAENALWQDTPLSQVGRARLAKGGAVVERAEQEHPVVMMLQTFPKQNRYVAVNPVPNCQFFRFAEPGGVSISADGALSMGFFSIRNSNEVEIDYYPFSNTRDTIPASPAGGKGWAASAIFIAGAAAKPSVTLNKEDVTGRLKAFRHDNVDGWLVAVDGDLPADDEIARRLSDADPRR